MLNLIQILRQAFAAPDPAPASRGDPDDPFAHPVIGGMSPTQLADLPFPRTRPAPAARPACRERREAA